MKIRNLVTGISLAALVGAAALPATAAGFRQPGYAPAAQFVPLAAEEAETLRFVREEEKMARDVYITLHEQWQAAIFGNISASEQRHMDAMARQLDKYGIDDPVTDDTVGAFTNETLGSMYLDLVNQGSESLEQALRAGALIEEVDIRDLEEAIAGSSHPDVIRAYENLMRGSRNHLRAFVRQLENLGVVYEAVVLDPEQLDEIVDSPMERGGSRGCRGRGCRF